MPIEDWSKARVVVYPRVSSDIQRDLETIEVQREKLQRWLANEGITKFDWIEDNGLSGETIDGRPGFSKIMALAKARAFDLLVVTTSDRLTRSSDEMERARISKTLREGGVRIAILNEGNIVNLANPTQNLFFSINTAFSSHDKQAIVRKLTEGRESQFKRGGRYAGNEPYGYVWVPGSQRRVGEYVVDEEQAAIIRLMAKMTLEGKTLMQVVTALNDAGKPFRKVQKNQSGKWTHTSARRVLINPAIKGEWPTLKGKYVKKLPPILDEETWARVKYTITSRRFVKREDREPSSRQPMLLSRIRCAICRYAMWSMKASKCDYNLYRCATTSTYKRLGWPRHCGNKAHIAHRIDDEVWEVLCGILSSPEALAQCAQIGAEQMQRGVDWRAQLAQSRRVLEELEQLGDETLDRRRRGIITATQCDKELIRIAAKREMHERQVETSLRQLAEAGDAVNWMGRIEEAQARLGGRLQSATLAERIKIVHALFPRGRAHIYVNRDGTWEAKAIFSADGHELPFQFESETRKAG